MVPSVSSPPPHSGTCWMAQRPWVSKRQATARGDLVRLCGNQLLLHPANSPFTPCSSSTVSAEPRMSMPAIFSRHTLAQAVPAAWGTFPFFPTLGCPGRAQWQRHILCVHFNSPTISGSVSVHMHLLHAHLAFVDNILSLELIRSEQALSVHAWCTEAKLGGHRKPWET